MISSCKECVHVLFFFQAEDGIRDLYGTGFQTCALPILGRSRSSRWRGFAGAGGGRAWCPRRPEGADVSPGFPPQLARRSEERRVGKECRSRWSQIYLIKKGSISHCDRCMMCTSSNVRTV